MIAASLAVELAGPRLALQCPASRRRPSLVARPTSRCCSPSPNPRPFSHLSSCPPRHPWIHAGTGLSQAKFFHGTATKAAHEAFSEPRLFLGKEEADLLASLQSRYPHVTVPTPVNPFALLKEQISKDQQAAASRTPAKLPQSRDAQADALAGDDARVSPRHQRHFTDALDACRQWDSRRLILHLRHIVALPQADLEQAIAALPYTTVWEFLRSLDPKQFAKDNDPSDGARISVGMWHILNMDQHMDSYGTRKLFKTLLARMLSLVECVQTNGRPLDPEDYVSLFRAYGTCSDIAGAKKLWDHLFGRTLRRPSPVVLNEYIKVRFLVDPMYYGYDKTRIIVTPRNLHRRGYLRFHASLGRLERLRFNRQRRAYRFGLDRSSPDVAMSLSRRIRGTGPITRLFKSWIHRRYALTEEILCDFMKGFARAGSLRFIGMKILPDYFGILTKKDKKTGEITTETVLPNVAKNAKRPRQWTPTARLFQTLVEVYCSNGQLGWAFTLIGFMSREYKIPIPPEAWFELLEWSHVLSSTPVATAWKMAGWYQQIPSKDATELVWNTMSQPPYNVQPGFDQYAILLRAQIARGRFVKADDPIMDKMRTLYDEQCVRYEDAVFAYTAALRDGVRPMTALWIAYQRARFRRQQMWFALSLICKRNLLALRPVTDRPNGVADTRAVVDVPDFVWRNERFVESASTRYRLATGYVHLRDPARPGPISLHVRRIEQPLRIPMKAKGQWTVQIVRPKRWNVLSEHSLAPLKNSRLDPAPLLSGGRDTFRLPKPRNHVQRFAYFKRARQFAAEGRRLEARIQRHLGSESGSQRKSSQLGPEPSRQQKSNRKRGERRRRRRLSMESGHKEEMNSSLEV
ncbi:hypothetical protein PG995_011670 [Apiospora arundinis]